MQFTSIRAALLAAAIIASFTACVGEAASVTAPDGDVVPPPNQDPLLGCTTGCHGDSTSNAPPMDLSGQTSTELRTVGAHRNHLDPAPTWFRRVECQDCHVVPDSVGAAGHLDGDNVAEITFGAISQTRGLEPSWNGETCANVYCHGAALPGGALTEPRWTQVDGSQAVCGNCHGAPPPAPHPQDMNCGGCHPTMQPNSMTFLDPASHINGVVDLTSDNQACDGCHGSGGISAPPVDLDGNTERAAQGVGAHRVHLGTSTWYREIACASCHLVPTSVAAPGHIDPDNVAEVTFDSMNPAASYANASCASMYCHGDGWRNLGTESWTSQVAMTCNSCHEDGRNGGRTMSGDHRKHIADEGMPCSDCHATVINAQMAIIDPNLHINGLHEIVMPTGGTFNAIDRRCTNLACHENERWGEGDDD